MHIAACAGDHALYIALELAGVEPTVVDFHGHTAGHYLAESSGHPARAAEMEPEQADGTSRGSGSGSKESATSESHSALVVDLGPVHALGRRRDAATDGRKLSTNAAAAVGPGQSRSMLLSVVLNRKAKQGDIAGVRSLLDKIPDHLSTIADYDLRTPLHLAASEGNTDVRSSAVLPVCPRRATLASHWRCPRIA